MIQDDVAARLVPNNLFVIRRASSTEPHLWAWSAEGKIAEPLTACTGVDVSGGTTRSIVHHHRSRRLSQT